MDNICCFIGHRKIDLTKQLEEKTKKVIEDLIVNKNVATFLFGSKSEFDSLCHRLVSNLKEKYPHIKRIAYTCRSESCILESGFANNCQERLLRISMQVVRKSILSTSFFYKF